jgi:GNAT superfamily N-acetyltransferase
MTSQAPPYRAVLVCLAILALATALFSVPGAREKVSLLERDDDLPTALEYISRRLEAGERDPAMLDAAVRLHLRAADIQAAAQTVELYAASLPDDYSVQNRLLGLLREQQQTQRYIETAERIYERWAPPRLIRELLDDYRLRQKFDQELKLLEVATGTGYAAVADIERLGMIKAAQGDLDAALQLLLDADNTRQGIGRAARISLFQLLIDSHQVENAFRRARKWLLAQPDAAAAIDFCAHAVVAGYPKQAIAFTREMQNAQEEVYVRCAERVSVWGEADRAAEFVFERIKQ